VTTLDNLRKTAKRWLKALHAGDASARERLRHAYPSAPTEPTLRDVQHALARERGHESWVSLTASVNHAASPAAPLTTGGTTHAERVATFLTFACWDHHVHGKSDHRMYDRAAARLLQQHPEIARDSLFTAIVSGEIAMVEDVLLTRPEAAREPGGSRGWTPILYLCFTRFSHPATVAQALAIARALLERGANPNDFYMAGDARYSALTGVAGEGEQDAPRQPYARELFQLLLDYGANPFDIQVLYDTHFSGDVLWWLELIYAHTAKAGRTREWTDPNWSMLDMGGYGSGARFLLDLAVKKRNPRLAEWVLARGARPDPPPARDPRFPKRSVYEDAMIAGEHGIAELLVRHGATPVAPTLSEEEEYVGACLRLDRTEIQRHLERHPEYLRSPAALFEAARRDRADVVALLLDLGVPIEIEGRNGERALHAAAGHNALNAARLLVERGAEIDPRERSYNSTPIGFASYGDHVQMIDFLSRYSRNIWTLTFRGYADRVRAVLREQPDLAKSTTKDGVTPLWWLPDDEEKALQIVDALVQHGADPNARSKEGSTALDWALRRGMARVAQRLIEHGATSGAPASGRSASGEPPPDLAKYTSLAQDLLFAFETGRADALERLAQHYARSFSWEELRTQVRARLDAIDAAERPDGYFALPHAQLLVARGAGFDNWRQLASLFEAAASTNDTRGQFSPVSLPAVAIPSSGMVPPIEVRLALPVRMRDGSVTTTSEIWEMLTAARGGAIERVNDLVARCPALVLCDYNYMPPLHLAVREGHLDLVRHLVDLGAANPNHVTYPYRESLVVVARDRGCDDIAQLLEQAYRDGDHTRKEEEGGEIDYRRDDERVRFQRLVNMNALDEVRTLLEKRPELALDELAFWAEGVLSMPANRRYFEMIDLLIDHGARVPTLTKWGAWYYLKHEDVARHLLSRGMSAQHMNVHRTTLLHDMAYTGDIAKALLLLEHGADMDALDEEFQSTPLGLAARFGKAQMVEFLLDQGADPNKAGAAWATPVAWALSRGHTSVADRLRSCGAHM